MVVVSGMDGDAASDAASTVATIVDGGGGGSVAGDCDGDDGTVDINLVKCVGNYNYIKW